MATSYVNRLFAFVYANPLPTSPVQTQQDTRVKQSSIEAFKEERHLRSIEEEKHRVESLGN